MSELGQVTSVTPIEHVFYADDRPQHSMCFFLRIQIEGVPDQAKLDESFRFALARHPLLRAILKGDPKGVTSGLEWHIEENVSHRHVIWNVESFEPIRIDQDCGVRLFVQVEREAENEMVFQFHHSATDARGAIQFVEDVLTVYSDQKSALLELDPGLLALRADTGHEGINHKLNALRYVERSAGFFLQKCASVASHTHATGEFDPTVWPRFMHHTFDQGEVRRLKNRSIQKQCTINDLLLRDVLIALSDWNLNNGVKQNIRIGMPINMRTASEGRMPAANCVSMCNIERAPEHFRDPWKLLSSINRETTYIKENRLGYALLLMTGALSKVRGGIQSLLKHKKAQSPLATSLVSNLGEIFRYAVFGKSQDGYFLAGNLKLLNVDLVPPVRIGTKVAFGVVTCLRRMTVTMQYDQTSLSREDARLIFDAVITRLTETVGKGTVGGEDLKALIDRHKKISVDNPGFRSLPLGKHVATSARVSQTEGKPGHGTFEQIH